MINPLKTCAKRAIKTSVRHASAFARNNLRKKKPKAFVTGVLKCVISRWRNFRTFTAQAEKAAAAARAKARAAARASPAATSPRATSPRPTSRSATNDRSWPGPFRPGLTDDDYDRGPQVRGRTFTIGADNGRKNSLAARP